MSNKYLNLDWLKSNCEMIHYFGLGFIQIKITKDIRMHFYNAYYLPPIIGKEEVHNHRYDFSSSILYGEFEQEFFQVIEGSNYIQEKESCKVDVEVTEPGILCGLRRISSSTYRPGSQYWVDHSTFHRVEARCCITQIIRSDYQKEFAEVIRPINSEKTCPFSKQIPPAQLWEIVDAMLVKSAAS